ncbi:MAG: hypothetical protein MJB57_16185 [Gemmatimonadetes bacterium]|nr:hypothetical protein [Gemmatimonadota bacterium]
MYRDLTTRACPASPSDCSPAVFPNSRREDSTLDSFWNAWGQPVLGLIEIGLLLAAVYLTIAQFRRSRASSYIERFNSRDMMESRVSVDRWLRENETSADRLAALEDDPRLATEVRQFANLFQELGAAYQLRVAHRKTVRRLFDALVVMYWERLRFWIREYRARADPTLYARFEYLYEELRSDKKRSASTADYVIAYGSLMEPTSLGAALGRVVAEDELIPATLASHERGWTVADRVTLSEAEAPTLAAFLDLVPSPDAETRVLMFRARAGDVTRLRRREKHYDLIDVTPSVRLASRAPLHAGARALVFLGRAEHRIDASAENVVILRGYLDRVIRAARTAAIDCEREIEASAAASGLPIVEGEYAFVDPGQAALV